MPAPMEFEDRSIEKALNKACETLNISKKALKYDIISYGSTGIFGLVGIKKARIRVIAPETKITNNNKKIEYPKVDCQSLVEKGCSGLDHGQEGNARIPEADALLLGREVLQKVLDAITSDARIVEIQDDNNLIFNVEGGNAAVLIGKRGQTLDAIQYLVEKIVNKHSQKRLRLQVDVEGYLESRKKNLEDLAFRLAQKAQKNRKPMTIGQLKPQERRVVHLALKDYPDVRTQSVGEGFIRKLMIIPQKKASANDGKT